VNQGMSKAVAEGALCRRMRQE